MALIKFGNAVQDARGSLGGTVYSRNRGGAYIRSKVSACQPVSAFSSAARAIFKAVAQYWAVTLSDAQRAAWDTFATFHPYVNVFGDSIQLSGIAMFEAVNRSIRQIGADWIDDPPDTFAVADLGDTAAVITAAGGIPTDAQITIGRALEYAEGLYVFATNPAPWTQKVQKTDFKLVNTPASGLYDVSADFSDDLILRMPGQVWTTGQNTNLKIMAMSSLTGARSAPVVLKVQLT